VIVTVSNVASDDARFTVTGTAPSTSDIYYYFSDALGTARVITASDGTVCYDADMYPYGGVRAYNVSCAPNHVFTGKERDSESGLDNFGARYMSSQYGRFMTPDPAGMLAADPSNPQSWNMYSYVLNNPLSLVDPTGEEYCRSDYNDDSGDTQICDVSDRQYSQDPWSFGAAGYSYFDINAGAQQDTSDNPNNITVFDSSLLFQIQQGVAGQKANVLAQLNQSPQTLAPNNAPQTPWYNTCTAKALGKGALAFGIDSIGLFASNRTVSTAVGDLIGWGGIVATQQGSKTIAAVGMATGIGATGMGLFGSGNSSWAGKTSIGLGLASMALAVAGNTPGTANLLSLAAMTADAVDTGIAVSQCK